MSVTLYKWTFHFLISIFFFFPFDSLTYSTQQQQQQQQQRTNNNPTPVFFPEQEEEERSLINSISAPLHTSIRPRN